jgi:hypothetical protein
MDAAQVLLNEFGLAGKVLVEGAFGDVGVLGEALLAAHCGRGWPIPRRTQRYGPRAAELGAGPPNLWSGRCLTS